MVMDIMERGMRRKERSMDLGECLEFLERVEVGRLGLTDGDVAYVVPLNFVLYDKRIYAHGAGEGLKMDIIRRDSRVCFEADEFYGVKKGKTPCGYSAMYRSIIAFGRVKVVESKERKASALKELAKKYSGSDCSPEISLEEMEKTTVLEITIEKMSGKKANNYRP
jgi:nitroimidazol reductase NimA-like FMN-containing flavoprotein (pyridoxamine 5'-phosphate oxidase superfamily)